MSGGSTGSRVGGPWVLREAQIRSTFWSRRSLLTSGWVKRNVPRLRCLSGWQPRTATWPGCRVNVAASSRSVSSSWPSLTMNRCGAIDPPFGTAPKPCWIGPWWISGTNRSVTPEGPSCLAVTRHQPLASW